MILSEKQKNEVLHAMAQLLEDNRAELLAANKRDIELFAENDPALFDRLKVDDVKINDMIKAAREVAALPDPVGRELYRFNHPNGMTVVNQTAAFGTILIIYESRPDVTIEAAAIAFKSGNHILLKGGKEARHSNHKLVECWHRALTSCGLPTEWITYLDYDRQQTRDFLRNPDGPLDLIVPRGGEGLIRFVKSQASCPVLVSGRGNNFLYVHPEARTDMAQKIILNAKCAKISACNALDKVLVDIQLPGYGQFAQNLIDQLVQSGVKVWVTETLEGLHPDTHPLDDDALWSEEFLDYKIIIGTAQDMEDAIARINRYSGGHSATIVTENADAARHFMASVDAAAVYHNASTRFTDGGQFGMGAELAISTDKMHHRGPLGLSHLVTNKWFIYGNGQTR
ncbi:MAG: glutamate-5-semialdehyde dehydrogenase [Bacteroidetes bacterium]|nr:MAG: glutamate-5-semialdehyde dehydrogenase [Bacteroidota bacterium]